MSRDTRWWSRGAIGYPILGFFMLILGLMVMLFGIYRVNVPPPSWTDIGWTWEPGVFLIWLGLFLLFLGVLAFTGARKWRK